MFDAALSRNMETKSPALSLDRTYALTNAFQWAREAYANSYQCDATKIDFGTEWHGVKTHGVYRRLILDNGPGIERDKMYDYLNKVGGSGKTVGVTDGNFGIGIKTSLLPWNHLGVVFISRTANGQTTLMWLHRADEENYAARTFNIHPDDDPTTVVRSNYVDLEQWDAWYDSEETDPEGLFDWKKVFPANQKTGLAIVLLGNSLDQDTILGDPTRTHEANKYGITQYLNARFYDAPVEVSVEQFGVWSDRSKWPTTPIRKTRRIARDDDDQNRKAVGLKRVIEEKHTTGTGNNRDRGLAASGEFTVAETRDYPGVKFHWTLVDKAVKETGHLVTMPMTGILHTSHDGIGEVYDLAAMGAKSVVSAKARMGRFVVPEPVRDRLAILIEPLPSKRHTIFTDEARNTLKFKNSTDSAMEMPWDVWVEKWHEHTPKAVRDAVTAYYAEKAEKSGNQFNDDALLKRIGTSFAERTKFITAHQSDFASGTVFGRNPAAQGTRKATKKKPVTDMPDASSDSNVTPLRKKSAPLGIVVCRPINDPEREDSVWYDPTERCTFLNTGSAFYTRLVEDFMRQASDKGYALDDEALLSIATNVYTTVCQDRLTVTGTAAVQSAAANPREHDQYLSPIALRVPLTDVLSTEAIAIRKLSHNIGARGRQQAMGEDLSA